MKINIVSDKESWINKYIKVFIDQQKNKQFNFWSHDINLIKNGDICFLLGCSQFMSQESRKKNKHNLVVHESNLPKGRGWSPLTWQILDGKNIIPISIIEVEEKIDSGLIYDQEFMHFEGHELVNELRYIQAKHTFSLCEKFIKAYPNIVNEGKKQFGTPTFLKEELQKIVN